MKFCFLLVLPLFVLSGCAKDNSIVEVETPSPETPPDSAQFIYVTAESRLPPNKFFAYNANGQERWKLPGVNRGFSNDAFSDDVLYMDEVGKISAVNAQTGSVKWSVPAYLTLTQLKIYGDTLLTASSNMSSTNEVLLYNKNTGDLLTYLVITNQPVVSPVMSGGKVYCLTTNANGTQLNLAAYDVGARKEVWKKPISAGFLMSGLPEIIVRGDTLITGAFGNAITLVNKNTGDFYWTKGLNTSQSFLLNNEIVYNDQNTGCVTKISLATGATTFQGQMVAGGRANNGLSYVYNNHFYTQVHDSLYRTNLTDGTLRRTKIHPAYYTKFIVVGKTVYAANNEYTGKEESRIMMLQADNLERKDSIIVPAEYVVRFNVLSTSKRFY